MSTPLHALLAAVGVDPATLAHLFPSGEDGIYRISTSGETALDVWRRLRASVESSGYWPLILGGGINHHIANDPQVVTEHPVADTLRAADAVDIAAFLGGRLDEQAESDLPEHGEWPSDTEPSSDFTIPYETLSKKPRSSVSLALLPTAASWECAAYFRFGGWNECPYPAEQVAMHRWWAQEYGAELVGMSDDVIEISVGRPPRDRESALKLAMEQYAYCADIVDQGTGTIEALGATLLNAPVWYFWWD